MSSRGSAAYRRGSWYSAVTRKIGIRVCREETLTIGYRARVRCAIFDDVDILHTCTLSCTHTCVCVMCVRFKGYTYIHSIVSNGRLNGLIYVAVAAKQPVPSVRFLRRSPCTSKSRRKCLNLDHTPIIIYDMYTRAALPKRAAGQVLIGLPPPPRNVSIRSRKRLLLYGETCGDGCCSTPCADVDKTNCSDF